MIEEAKLDEFQPPTEEVGWLKQLAVQLEASHHEAGWDEVPPMLYRVHQIDALADDLDALATAKFAEIIHGGKALVLHPMPLGDPAAELPAMAFGFRMILEVELDDAATERAELIPMVKETFSKPLMALAFVTEAWLRTSEMDNSEEMTKPFADIPGSVEVRQAIIVNNDGFLMLTRERGKEPTVSYCSRTERSSKGERPLSGTVAEALIDLYDVGKSLESKVVTL